MTKTRTKKKATTREQTDNPSLPMLRFTPTAWAKLLFLRDCGDSEVGGFGVSVADDLLLVEDIGLVDQVCDWAHVAFSDDSVADYFDQQVDEGRRPDQFGRIWVHTHPGDCPRPSGTDETTFERVFGRSDWSLMFILARGGQTYARLRLNVGPRGQFEIPVGVDYSRPFDGCDHDAWERNYLTCVQPRQQERLVRRASELERSSPFDDDLTEEWRDGWFEYADAEDQTGGFIQ